MPSCFIYNIWHVMSDEMVSERFRPGMQMEAYLETLRRSVHLALCKRFREHCAPACKAYDTGLVSGFYGRNSAIAEGLSMCLAEIESSLGVNFHMKRDLT